MAEIAGVVIPILQPLINRLAGEAVEPLQLIRDLDRDMESLKNVLETIGKVLEDAERQQITRSAVAGWLKNLKNSAYAADDVVDEFYTRARRKHHGHAGMLSRFKFRLVMAKKIRYTIKRLDDLCRLGNSFGLHRVSSSSLIILDGGGGFHEFSRRIRARQTDSDVIVSGVYGRDVDRDKVVDLLLKSSRERENEIIVNGEENLSVIPIYGIGGVGKTTFARYIFNDPRLKKPFKCRKWVYVGQKFDVSSILAAIAECDTSLTIQTMGRLVKEEVRQRRFLLVLDDVWKCPDGQWKELKKILLKAGNKGSKIIATTRNTKLADMMRSAVDKPYKLEGLSDDDCWKLFRQMAFGPGGQQETDNLVAIGKKIIPRCDGIPLAAETLGSIMAARKNEQDWLDIQDSQIWELAKTEDEDCEGILPALRLSYDFLPSSYLKQCFTYCSMFPKGYEINRLKLIQLWTAEGFVQTSSAEPGREANSESSADEYFDTLMWHLSFRDEKKDEYGDILSCKMFDVVHQVACSTSKDAFFVEDVQSTESVVHLRKRYSTITVDGTITQLTVKVGKEAKMLRSLHILPRTATPAAIEKLELILDPALTHLRVLDLSDVEMAEFPCILGKLYYLRFLGFSSSSVQVLPDSVSTLCNLQTLHLKGCSNLRELPRCSGDLIRLRHLEISNCDNLINMPAGLGQLTALQTLPLFVVGEAPEHCVSSLQNLNSIRGGLKIRHLQNVKDPAAAERAGLKHKAHVHSLELSWSMRSSALSATEDFSKTAFDVLEKLQPHQSLKRLVIKGFEGKTFPDWLPLLLPNVKKIVLEDCRRCEQLPLLGQLRSLEHLDIHKLSSLKRIESAVGYTGNAFPSLKFLNLWELHSLVEWTVPEEGTIMFPRLEKLHLLLCSQLAIKPYMPASIRELIINESKEELLSADEGEMGNNSVNLVEAAKCLKGLSRLRSLKIESMGASNSSGWQGLKYLTSLEKLEINSCHKLSCFPLGVLRLPSLQTLELRDNTNLESLKVVVEEREEWPLFCSSLQRLIIANNGALSALPEWVGGLTSLHSLDIRNCPKLQTLPECLKSLEHLHHLTIHGCAVLRGRCKEGGDDWDKISHIQNIDTDESSFLQVHRIIS